MNVKYLTLFPETHFAYQANALVISAWNHSNDFLQTPMHKRVIEDRG